MSEKSHRDNPAQGDAEDFGKYCRVIPDFPKPGIMFRDITSLLKDGPVFQRAIDAIARNYALPRIDAVIGIEARGFIIGSALAYRLGTGMVPVRKKGKLPWRTYRERYDLEYGQDELEVHQDGIEANQNVLIVDDVIATGGTVQAVARLVRGMKGNIVGAAFLIEIEALKGRGKLEGIPVYSLIKY